MGGSATVDDGPIVPSSPFAVTAWCATRSN